MKDVRHKRLPATCVHLYEMSRKDKRMRKESRLPGADSSKEDSLRMSLNDLQVDGSVLTLNCSDGCPALEMYQKSLSCTLKMGELYGMQIIPQKYTCGVKCWLFQCSEIKSSCWKVDDSISYTLAFCVWRLCIDSDFFLHVQRNWKTYTPE